LHWHQLEFYGLVNFTLNTFTGQESGYGDESPAAFNPECFDAGQIADAARIAGMAGLILTCKHHDGFCLWPSRFTHHSVRHSPWRNGRGDLVKELAAACHGQGLRFGVHLSPWDRNHPDYGRPGYLAYYRNQLHELLADYGPLFEIWFAGGTGGDGYYGGARERRTIAQASYYGWEETWKLARLLQPEAVLSSAAGPDVRWVGNGEGDPGEPGWSRRGAAEFAPGPAAAAGPESRWLPAECELSLRPSWFHHPAEDDKLRSPEKLEDLYFRSVGQGAALLLNLAPDRRGLIPAGDVAVLQEFRRRLDARFATNLARMARIQASNVRGDDPCFSPERVADAHPESYWCSDDAAPAPEIIFDFPIPVKIATVSLREHLPLGQRVERFAVDRWDGEGWAEVATGGAIGARRLLRLPPCETPRLRLRILQAAACPAIEQVGLYAPPAA
jgi:alpha-L-fucosidase